MRQETLLARAAQRMLPETFPSRTSVALSYHTESSNRPASLRCRMLEHLLAIEKIMAIGLDRKELVLEPRIPN